MQRNKRKKIAASGHLLKKRRVVLTVFQPSAVCKLSLVQESTQICLPKADGTVQLLQACIWWQCVHVIK